jgi:hypothetical protein
MKSISVHYLLLLILSSGILLLSFGKLVGAQHHVEYRNDSFLPEYMIDDSDLVWHVSLVLTDGSKKNGYLVWKNKNFNEFLKSQSPDMRYRRFDFYSDCYRVNDGGPSGGLVLCREDIDLIWPESVKKIQALPDQPDEAIKKNAYYLDKEEVKTMQNPLVFSVTGGDGPCELNYFNYNPTVSRGELEHYTKEFEELASQGESDEYDELVDKLKNKKIVFVTLGCDPTD